MGWTKRQLVEAAYGELALGGMAYDLQPNELNYGLLKLDTTMGTLLGQGISLGYLFGVNQTETDLDQDSGIPLIAVEAVYKRLAIDIAASKGKTLARSTVVSARAALEVVMGWCLMNQMKQQQLRGGTVRGSGWRYEENPFVPEPDTAPLRVATTGDLLFTGH